MIKQYLSAVVFMAMLSISMPIGVQAQVVSPAQSETKRALLEQIEALLREVVRLQDLLQKSVAKEVQIYQVANKPHQLVFYDLPFEQIYFVRNGNLVPESGGSVRPIDAALFTLFTQVVGKTAVEEYVAEWRVFNTEREDIGAFVESIPEEGTWVVGVNRAGYGTDSSAQESFAKLFLHEFAHIILYDLPEFTDNYTKKFWTSADVRHTQSVARARTGRERFLILENYYSINSDRFVSDYATLSADEDMAETFVAFVIEGTPRTKGIVAEKIETFYSEPALVLMRDALRTRVPLLLK